MTYILYFIFYGLVVTVSAGLLTSWVDRKITARVQYRTGPPLFQPVYDIIKLLGKETVMPRGAVKSVYLGAPMAGFAAAALTATMLWVNNIHPERSFLGDLIVVIYLLVVPSLSIIIGGFASRTPLASLGAGREMKLMLGYELPFLLAVLVPVIKAGYSLRLGDIMLYQAEGGMMIGSLSGFISFIVILVCAQAKLGLVPFDAAESETEIMSGPFIEYSGSPLAIFRLTKNMLLFILPFFIILLFLGGLKFSGMGLLYSVLKYVLLVFLITVIRNTNPRIRIDQALKFFWGPMTVLGAAGAALALAGL